jgi:hypothetical protein
MLRQALLKRCCVVPGTPPVPARSFTNALETGESCGPSNDDERTQPIPILQSAGLPLLSMNESVHRRS